MFRVKHSGQVWLTAADDVADLHTYKIASTQLAIDREVKQRAITQAAAFIQIESNLPYLLRLECALGANSPPRVPDLALGGSRFGFRHLHDHSPVTTMVTWRMSVGRKTENAAALTTTCGLRLRHLRCYPAENGQSDTPASIAPAHIKALLPIDRWMRPAGSSMSGFRTQASEILGQSRHIRPGR